MNLLKRVASAPLAVVLLLYDAADALLFPVLRPAIAWLAARRAIRRVGEAIAALPAYVVLALLAVPFAAIEPFKLIGLYWMAQGRFSTGLITLVLAHALSIVVCERIFHAGREKLLTIGWFATGYRFVDGLRRQALGWLRATAFWRSAAALGGRLRLAARRRLGRA